MKYTQALSLFCCLWIGFSSCKKTSPADRPKPEIEISEEYTKLKTLNEGETISIPVEVRSTLGIKRLAYYIIRKTSNGTASSTPIYLDPTDAPKRLTETISFTATNDFLELVVIAFDVKMGNSEIHIAIDQIRSVQRILFKDGVRSRPSVFEGKRIMIEGQVESEFDLSELAYQTIINGTPSSLQNIAISNPLNASFAVPINVVKGLSAIVLHTKNKYNALVRDTFSIGSVQDDAVVLALKDNKTAVERLYATVQNTIEGQVFSGSDMTSFSYAVKKDGQYGAEINLPLGTPADEFGFSIQIMGEAGIEAIRLKGENAGGKTKEVEFVVHKLYRPLKVFRNVVLTTEIGPGKNNFFSAYQEPHVFGIENAAPYDELIDIGFFKYTATSNNIMPPGVFVAGPAYANALAPYLVGFDKAAYTLVTANRPSVNNFSFDTLHWDEQLMEHVQRKVAAPTAQGGENYNIYGTDRRTNNVFNVGQGFYIGWGRWQPILNQSFGIVIVRSYVVSGQFATLTLDIKVPEEDQRRKFNSVSLFNYP